MIPVRDEAQEEMPQRAPAETNPSAAHGEQAERAAAASLSRLFWALPEQNQLFLSQVGTQNEPRREEELGLPSETLPPCDRARVAPQEGQEAAVSSGVIPSRPVRRGTTSRCRDLLRGL